MQTEFVDSHCRTLPGSYADRPFGPDTQVWKIAGKMFAAYTTGGHGVSITTSNPVMAQRLIQRGKAVSAPYLKDGGWVMLPWGTAPEELRVLLTESYLSVRMSLSPGLQAELPPLPSDTVH